MQLQIMVQELEWVLCSWMTEISMNQCGLMILTQSELSLWWVFVVLYNDVWRSSNIYLRCQVFLTKKFRSQCLQC